MHIALTKWQETVLKKLLDQYENSKTYQGTNRVSQTFSVTPSKIYPEYSSDYADMDLVRDFESQMKELEDRGLLTVQSGQGEIKKLTADPQRWESYYEILHITEKRIREQRQIKLYTSFLGEGGSLERFCTDQIRRLEEGKKPRYSWEEASAVLKLWKFLLKNREGLLERELSIAVLGDSKSWQEKYRAKVCRLLQQYEDLGDLLSGVDDKRERERIILGEYYISSNPSFVFFKGNAKLLFHDGQELKISLDMPMAFTDNTLKNLRSLKIMDKTVMTVENLTSFHRMKKEGIFYIFLSGYHNSVKQKLICEIDRDNEMLEWRHFGDIDPDGFYIIEHLKRGTGIEFMPAYMDTSYLMRYDPYTKPLEENDIRKARTLSQQGKYVEVMGYMLKEKKKLEQEIISWMEH